MTCYSPDLEHATCPDGDPIHYDNTGRYPTEHWVHCTIADVVACPLDLEDAATGYTGRHRG